MVGPYHILYQPPPKGKNVGGHASVSFGAAKGTVNYFFSESTFYIETGDASEGGPSVSDGALAFATTPGATWTASDEHLRGGFRYLRVVVEGGDASDVVEITNVSLAFSPAPHVAADALRAYKSHFLSSDVLLNKIWYGTASCFITVTF